MAGKHIIYVYGTLRPGAGETVLIPGTMYDLGWYPGVKLGGKSQFVAERIEVDDDRLQQLDNYEGYNPHNHESSLFIRRHYLDGWIYEYNQQLTGSQVISSGDWLAYTKEKKGRAAHLGKVA